MSVLSYGRKGTSREEETEITGSYFWGCMLSWFYTEIEGGNICFFDLASFYLFLLFKQETKLFHIELLDFAVLVKSKATDFKGISIWTVIFK